MVFAVHLLKQACTKYLVEPARDTKCDLGLHQHPYRYNCVCEQWSYDETVFPHAGLGLRCLCNSYMFTRTVDNKVINKSINFPLHCSHRCGKQFNFIIAGLCTNVQRFRKRNHLYVINNMGQNLSHIADIGDHLRICKVRMSDIANTRAKFS